MTINPFILHGEEITPVRELLYLKAFAGGAPLKEYEVTGNPAVFQTNVAKPLSAFTIPFLPVQTGSGDPSPDNVRPIIGWQGLTASRGGKNLFDISAIVSGSLDGYGELVPSANRTTSPYILLSPGTWRISRKHDDWWKVACYDLNKQFISFKFNNQNQTNTIAFTEPVYVRISFDYIATASDEVQFEAGDTSTSYADFVALDSYPVTFPDGQTVYGGTLDAVTGVLSVEWAFANLNSESAWGSYGTGDGFLVYVTKSDMQVGKRLPGYCDMFPSTFSQTGANIRFGADDNVIRIYNINTLGITDLSEWKEFIGTDGINVCYPLATPYEIQLDPITVQTLIGDNTIWTDTNGYNTIKYKKKG